MYVQLGNQDAIETGYDEDGRLIAKELPGERTTNITLPDELDALTAFRTTLAAMKRHIAPGASPVWIESDNKTVRRMLVEHYGLQITKSDRPDGWGEN